MSCRWIDSKRMFGGSSESTPMSCATTLRGMCLLHVVICRMRGSLSNESRDVVQRYGCVRATSRRRRQVWVTEISIELSKRVFHQTGRKSIHRLVHGSGTSSRILCRISTGSLKIGERSLCTRWRNKVAFVRTLLMDSICEMVVIS